MKLKDGWGLVAAALLVMLVTFGSLLVISAGSEQHDEPRGSLTFTTREVEGHGTCTFAIYEGPNTNARALALVGCSQ